ncbi:MAG: NAD-dependent epimerase/dehydratase family protein, partial [Ruminococcaceae bacterium]|nr:NAD-dependent epimerase/dehydratase family protein [Oscillospiraceae bacterium]
AEHIPPTTPLQKKIVAAFEEVLGRTGVGIRDDFFDLGGDSLGAVETSLILDIQVQDIYANPTAEMLEKYLSSHKEVSENDAPTVDVNQLIRDNANLDSDAEPKCVLLTGATGFLGSHILRELSWRNVKIVCLVRDYSKLKRVLEYYFPKEKNCFTYVTVEGDIEKPRFGLTDEIYAKLVSEVDMVIHTAANVSHAGHYPSLSRYVAWY